MKEYLRFSDEVQKAMKENLPVVALESTIISHGMPYPENLETARAVETIIRNEGAVPATIAILDGRVCVGLNDEQKMLLASSQDIAKGSRRDLPVLIAKKQNAATTVAASMICAHLAGITVFVTGGIGGVHRGADKTFDVSADYRNFQKPMWLL